MTALGEFLAELQRRGVTLSEDNGSLRYSAPKGAITPELREQLRTRKEEILALLRQMQRDASAPPLEPIAHTGAFPLSFGQERLFFL